MLITEELAKINSVVILQDEWPTNLFHNIESMKMQLYHEIYNQP